MGSSVLRDWQARRDKEGGERPSAETAKEWRWRHAPTLARWFDADDPDYRRWAAARESARQATPPPGVDRAKDAAVLLAALEKWEAALQRREAELSRREAEAAKASPAASPAAWQVAVVRRDGRGDIAEVRVTPESGPAEG